MARNYRKKRRNYRKKRKMVRYKQPKYDLDFHVFRMRLVAQLKTQATGLIQMRLNINSLSRHFIQGPTAGQEVVPLNEEAALTGLFDQYKVLSTTVTYEPYHNVSVISQATDGAPRLNAVGIYNAFDLDNTGYPADVTSLITRPKVKKFNSMYRFKCRKKLYQSERVFQGTNPSFDGWLNGANEGTNEAGVLWFISNTPVSGDPDTATPYVGELGDILVETIVAFRKRQ